jgi:uncharacterized damage-inducible protein DinB
MLQTDDQAKFMVEFLVDDFEREGAVTRGVFAAAPVGKEGYTPHEKNMTALDLAWHIASADVWFLTSTAAGCFRKPDLTGVPESIRSVADVAAWYDDNLPKAIAALRALTPSECARNVDFLGIMQHPTYNWVLFALKHSVHHRAQLSTYLRPMGGKVPRIIGPSGDMK